uniref:hypothetical protein n=1 Tax=Nocardioides sp. TaxID=35761 RepID=UPI00286DEEBB
MNTPTPRHDRAGRTALAASGLAAVLALATACGGSTTTGTNGSNSGTQQPAADQSAGAVLPVTDNPITNTSTAQTLTIDS